MITIEELKEKLETIDDKRHEQNNRIHDRLLQFEERVRVAESGTNANNSLLAVHSASIISLEKNHSRIEEVVRNNTTATNSLALAFTELSSSVKTGVRMAIFIVPVLSTLLAYIAHMMMGK